MVKFSEFCKGRKIGVLLIVFWLYKGNETIGEPDTLTRKGKTAEKLKDIKDKKRLRV